MSNIKLFTVALLAFGHSAFAQTPPDRPTGGGQFQQIPPAPSPQRAAPEIRIEQSKVPVSPGADQVRIPVQSLRVTGQTLYSAAELVALTGFSPNPPKLSQTEADQQFF